MNEPLVSVVVPAYRVGKMLERAILSIEKQTFSLPYEVILVVRESDDDTLAIAKKWTTQKPSRYRLFSFSENLGTGYSRLKGVFLSKGKYVYFLDGDDELLPKTLETFYKVMEETGCDIANSSFYVVRKGGKREKNLFSKKGTLDKKEAMNAFLKDISFRGFLWCKMFRRELFHQGPLLYLSRPDDMFEDMALLTALLSYAEKVVSFKEPLYLYHKDNPSSATTVKRSDRALSHLAVYALQRHYFEKCHPELAPLFFAHRFRMKTMLSYDLSLDKKAACSKDYVVLFKKEKKIVLSKAKSLLEGENSYKPILERAIVSKIDDIE